MSASLNYSRIAKAIEYIQHNFQQQPNLAEIAAHVHLSPAHFQRLFTEWVGISPKKFLQYTTIQHAKSILKHPPKITLLDTTFDAGLSSSSRLHDLFIQIEGMTPAEYRHGGQALQINYSFAETLFGKVLIASTLKGICYLAFIDNEETALISLRERFPKAQLTEYSDVLQQQALQIFQFNRDNLSKIKLHLKATAFQLKVWESLLKIPMGQLSAYGEVAKDIGQKNAARAVGTAIGHNPVAFLIPCHRVIQASGNFGGYMWGTTRKTAIIAWESAKVEQLSD